MKKRAKNTIIRAGFAVILLSNAVEAASTSSESTCFSLICNLVANTSYAEPKNITRVYTICSAHGEYHSYNIGQSTIFGGRLDTYSDFYVFELEHVGPTEIEGNISRLTGEFYQLAYNTATQKVVSHTSGLCKPTEYWEAPRPKF